MLINLYNSRRWWKLRDKKLWDTPYCALCNTTFKLQVDHIIEHNDNEYLFTNWANLQVLCERCHGYKSAQQSNMNRLNISDYTITIDDTNESNFNKYNSFYINETESITQVIREIEIKKNIIINTKTLNIAMIRRIVYELIITIKSKPKQINFVINLNRIESEQELLNMLIARG